ncbi:MAG: anaerobic ribonucleoside-triphosphate reductase activating protein [Clostridiales bacterium]|nr:anaerobic ribonucleoside-triphosphate reductase activating protein [Clostridiales bacterium]
MQQNNNMLIGGLQKFSLIDYPNKMCAVIFTQGCNFKCGYCHNPELVDPGKFTQPIPEKEVLSFLQSRRGKLDAVEITGGEPTLQKNLVDFIRIIKDMGYLVKLDSNGSKPEVLREIIDSKNLDYIAMDIKAPLKKYREIISVDINTDDIKKSIKLIMSSNLNYEFRTTVVKNQLYEEDFIEIGQLIKGTRLYVLQKFIPSKLNDIRFLSKTTYSDEEFENLKHLMQEYVGECTIR